MFDKKMIELNEKEEFIIGAKKSLSIGMAHIAVALATIKRDRMFIAVSKSWKDYIAQDRTNLGYENSKRLARIGDIYLNYRTQLEENGIKLSQNMSKMDLFDEEIASKDRIFYDKFKSLSYRALKKYIKEYKDGEYTVYSDDKNNLPVTVNNASLYIGEEKIRGINLNEIRRDVAEGKRFVLVAVEDDNEAKRVRRKIDNGKK